MPGEGRNAGGAHALGDMLLFLDADVVLPSVRFIEDALKEMQERHIGVATVRVKPLSNHALDRFFFGIYNFYAELTERFRPHAPGFCIFATKEAHEAINGFDEDVKFAEDMDYVQRAARAGFKFAILRNVPAIPTSTRRFEKDGHWRIAVKYVWAELHMIVRGPFKGKSPFTYEMGGK